MDYTDIYKRGVSAGIEKGKAAGSSEARNEIKAGVEDIVKGSGDNKIKLFAILDYLHIDNNIEDVTPEPVKETEDVNHE